MSAALSQAPAAAETIRFRRDLTVQKQVQSGEISYIVKDPKTRKYFRFRETEHAIFSRLDGQTPLPEVLSGVQGQFPHLGITAKDVAGFLASLKKANLLEQSAAEKNLLLLEKLRDQRQAKIKSQSSSLSRILYLHYHLVDPDRFFAAVLPWIRWMWSRPFVLGSLALFAFAGYFNLRQLGEIVANIAALYTFSGYGLWDYALLWILSLVAIVLHEFGHGLTCKRFGGEVHDLGVMLIFFNPAMYCNVSDAYLFENRRHKLYVTAAGGFVELWIWAVASVAWAATLPGTGIHDFAFKLIVVSGVSTLAFNFNPLMKLDGYYALLDVLGVANLRDRSFEWLGIWVKRNVFRMSVPPMAVEPRLARIYAIYGTLCALFTGAMLVVILFLLKNLILGKMHLAGLPIFLLLVYLLYGAMLRKAWTFLKTFAAQKRHVLVSPQIRAAALLTGALLVAGLFAIKAPVRVSAPFTLEPAAKLAVRPVVGGRVVDVRVAEGQVVAAGEVVATLANADLETALAGIEARRRQEDTLVARARYRGDLAELAAAEARLAEVDAALAKARQDVAALRLRAPRAGVVLTPRPGDRLGDRLGAADTLVEVADLRQLRAVLDVPENSVGDVVAGGPVVLAFKALPRESFTGTVAGVAPAGRSTEDPGAGRPLTHYAASVLVPNPGGRLRPGMTGEAKIYGERRRLYQLALHWAGKTFNPDFW